MIDLPLIILIALAHTSLALLISYVAWLIVQADRLAGSIENEGPYV